MKNVLIAAGIAAISLTMLTLNACEEAATSTESTPPDSHSHPDGDDHSSVHVHEVPGKNNTVVTIEHENDDHKEGSEDEPQIGHWHHVCDEEAYHRHPGDSTPGHGLSKRLKAQQALCDAIDSGPAQPGPTGPTDDYPCSGPTDGPCGPQTPGQPAALSWSPGDTEFTARVGVPFSEWVSPPAGGVTPIEIDATSLPEWLSYRVGGPTGLDVGLSGTPGGDASFTLTATDANDIVAEVSVKVTVLTHTTDPDLNWGANRCLTRPSQNYGGAYLFSDPYCDDYYVNTLRSATNTYSHFPDGRFYQISIVSGAASVNDEIEVVTHVPGVSFGDLYLKPIQHYLAATIDYTITDSEIADPPDTIRVKHSWSQFCLKVTQQNCVPYGGANPNPEGTGE